MNFQNTFFQKVIWKKNEDVEKCKELTHHTNELSVKIKQNNYKKKKTNNQLPTTSWGKIEWKKFNKDNDNNVTLWHIRNQFVTQQRPLSFVDFTLGCAWFEQHQLTLLHQRSMMIIFLSFAIHI